MSKQRLSAVAKRAKASRDKLAAMTPDRRKKKAENQRKRRAAIKAGKNIKGKDLKLIEVMTVKELKKNKLCHGIKTEVERNQHFTCNQGIRLPLMIYEYKRNHLLN